MIFRSRPVLSVISGILSCEDSVVVGLVTDSYLSACGSSTGLCCVSIPLDRFNPSDCFFSARWHPRCVDGHQEPSKQDHVELLDVESVQGLILQCQSEPSREHLAQLRDELNKVLGNPLKRKREQVAVQSADLSIASVSPVPTLCFRCDDTSYWEYFQDDTLVAVQKAGAANELPQPKHGNFVSSNIVQTSGNVQLLIGLKAPVLSCCVCKSKFPRTDVLRRHFSKEHPDFVFKPYHGNGITMVSPQLLVPLFLASVIFPNERK